jgi:pimeloyl-ACP methyl ester carboxylesterase
MAVAFTRLLRDDARPLLQRLTMPVLLLWGERDPLVPLVYAEQMRAMIPNSRLQVIPHAGHIPMWENPEAFNAALLEFLRTVDPSPAAREWRAAPGEGFSWVPSGVTSGIVHREAGRARDVVLIHGLGMSSAYFDKFARALFNRGRSPIAPDLPGFGESDNAPPGGPIEHASILATWADALAIRDATWIGHSLGCNAVAHVARARPDLVREWICIGPLWSPRSPARLLAALLIDAFREQLSLFIYVIPAYWRCGLWRWFATLSRYCDDLRTEPPSPARMIAGEKDPLPDRNWIKKLDFVPGAHACQFTFPAETASAVTEKLFDRVAGDQNEERDHRGDDGHRPLTGAARDSE